MCPPGVDQTTRSSERWTLLAPALEERYDITSDLEDDCTNRPDICKFLRNDFTWGAFDKLAEYRRNEEKALSLLSRLSDTTMHQRTSSLELLPTEIIRMIVSDSVLQPVDIVSLGLSSQLLWAHMLQHIASKTQRAPWAETPLVCTGTWTMSLPSAIHNLHPNIKQDEASFFDRASINPGWRPMRGTCPARKYNWNAVSEFYERNESQNGATWSLAFMELSNIACVSAESLRVLRKSLDAILNPARSSMPTTWCLQNLTTCEYVSLKASPMYGTAQWHVHVKGMPKLELGKAILLRICWSAAHVRDDDDNDDDEHSGDGSVDEHRQLMTRLKRGKWAGHCFRVVPSAEAHRVGGIVVWRDVTNELIQDARAWNKEFL